MLTQSGVLNYMAIRIQQKLQVSFGLNLKIKSCEPSRFLIVESMATGMWRLYICKELHCDLFLNRSLWVYDTRKALIEICHN